MHKLDSNYWAIPKDIQLADPKFNHPRRIDVLLGAVLYYKILSFGQIRLAKDLSLLQNTIFKWIIGGRIAIPSTPSVTCAVLNLDDTELHKQIKRFWQLEESVGDSTMTQQGGRCGEKLTQTAKSLNYLHFSVKLPF